MNIEDITVLNLDVFLKKKVEILGTHCGTITARCGFGSYGVLLGYITCESSSKTSISILSSVVMKQGSKMEDMQKILKVQFETIKIA